VPGSGVAIGASGLRGPVAAAWRGPSANYRLTPRTVSGMRPGRRAAASGLAGDGAWVVMRSRSQAAMTAQIAKTAMTSTTWRKIAV
jgi:hypothetical protein